MWEDKQCVLIRGRGQGGTHVQRSLISLIPAHYGHSSRPRITFGEPRYHNRQRAGILKICSLYYSLDPLTYNEITLKTKFWIEYALAKHSTTVDELVGEVSLVARNYPVPFEQKINSN